MDPVATLAAARAIGAGIACIGMGCAGTRLFSRVQSGARWEGSMRR